MATANPASITATPLCDLPIRLFLMINNFETGGSERQFAVLAQNLSRARFQINLGCVARRGPLADELDGVAQFPLGRSLFGWKALGTRVKLRRHLRQNKVEVAQAFDFYSNLTLIPSARLAGVPVVIGSHRQLGDLMSSAQFRAQALAFRFCDAVVCNSQAAAARLADAGVARGKLVIIGNALPSAAFERVSPLVPRPPGILRVGMVARMNARYKNHAGFLRIAAEIHKTMPNVEFLLVGEGPLRPEIERQAAALGLAGRAIFLGDRRDIPAVLASMDVSVLTSDSESLSNVILEAMAAGLPVVAYDAGGNAELIDEQRGALVSAGKENEFAAAVLRLLSDTDLRGQLGRSARRFVEENFGLDRVCRQYEDLYTRLLTEQDRRKLRV